MITKKNFLRHEFIGLKTKVLESKNKENIGLQGKIIDETRKTIKIEDEKREKTIPKKNTIFEIKLPNGKEVTVKGDEIRLKPENRIKKRFKRWKTL